MSPSSSSTDSRRSIQRHPIKLRPSVVGWFRHFTVTVVPATLTIAFSAAGGIDQQTSPVGGSLWWERGGSRRLRRGGEANSSAARPDVGTSLCPPFPSLKYYSVRVERGDSPRGTPARTLAVVIAPRATHTRHPLVTGFTSARPRSPRGCCFARTYGCYSFFFLRLFVGSVVLSSWEKTAKGEIRGKSRSWKKSTKVQRPKLSCQQLPTCQQRNVRKRDQEKGTDGNVIAGIEQMVHPRSRCEESRCRIAEGWGPSSRRYPRRSASCRISVSK